MPYTPEQEFGEMTLSDYDSNEDADFEPTYSEESSDDLEVREATLLSTFDVTASNSAMVWVTFLSMEVVR